MPSAEFDTTSLHRIISRVQDGDQQARNELATRIHQRLERLANCMLRRYPGVGRWEGFEDVLQNAYVRLFRALNEVKPENTRAFFGLATESLRRELIDLTRRYQGPNGMGTHHRSGVIDPHRPVNEPCGYEAVAVESNGDDLDRWRLFHEEVANLPVEERETFGLAYYHGWTHQQIAELFQCSERTIRRHWRSACKLLKQRLNGTWVEKE